MLIPKIGGAGHQSFLFDQKSHQLYEKIEDFIGKEQGNINLFFALCSILLKRDRFQWDQDAATGSKCNHKAFDWLARSYPMPKQQKDPKLENHKL